MWTLSPRKGNWFSPKLWRFLLQMLKFLLCDNFSRITLIILLNWTKYTHILLTITKSRRFLTLINDFLHSGSGMSIFFHPKSLVFATFMCTIIVSYWFDKMKIHLKLFLLWLHKHTFLEVFVNFIEKFSALKANFIQFT